MQVPSAGVPVKFMFFIFAALAWALGAPPAVAQNTPLGWWLDQTGKGGILIAPCGGQVCGRIEWLKVPLDAKGKPKTDIHNPDPALQRRPICGLKMMGGFMPDGSGSWTGGWVYDPNAGKTYKGVMHVTADGSLSLRGYVGIPLFGRSEVWTRPAAALPLCAGAP